MSTDDTNLLSEAQEVLIEKLVELQEEYESLSDEDSRKLTPFSLDEIKHFTELTALTTALICDFSMKLTGFDKLGQADKAILIEKASREVLILRAGRKYDKETDSIVFANNQPYTRENLEGFMGDFTDSLFNFCTLMNILEVDNVENALLTGIVIFSERPGLQEPNSIRTIRNAYILALKTYINIRCAQQNSFEIVLKPLLGKLVDLGEMYGKIAVPSLPIEEYIHNEN